MANHRIISDLWDPGHPKNPRNRMDYPRAVPWSEERAETARCMDDANHARFLDREDLANALNTERAPEARAEIRRLMVEWRAAQVGG